MAFLIPNPPILAFFFFNDTATTEIYTLSLHDALPIFPARLGVGWCPRPACGTQNRNRRRRRSEEHTSELQSPCNLVCRLLLEKKKKPPTHLRNHQVDHTSYRSGRSDFSHAIL